ncbi:MAG TPA: RsiV family protein [Pyrinomonadaceae bacterium]|nr:RsiV family protein [Pyrinomonadaceae bacterium]
MRQLAVNKKILACVLLAIVLSGCRRQVTVTQSSPNSATSAPTPQQYHLDAGVTLAVPQTKYFKGSIGTRLGLQMKLTRDGEKVAGNYSYQKVGTKIDLKGTVDKDNNLTLEEFDSGGKQTGLFKGTWTTDSEGLASVVGNWSKPNDEKKTAFSLHEEPIEFSGPVELTAKQVKETNKKLRYRIDAEYPQATGGLDTRFDKFNQEARGVVVKRIVDFKKQTVEIAADEAAQASATPEAESDATGNSLDIGYDVTLAKDDLISVKFDVGSYSAGAAHPNTVSAVLNYDVKTGKVLRLSDLFMPGAKYLQTISAYCIKDLKRQSKANNSLLDDESIQRGAGPDSENYQSWNITKKGLEITFDAYQVGAYAAGPQQVVIPYSALKELVRLDGPLTQFVK